MKTTVNTQLTVTEPLDLRSLPDEGLRFEEALPKEWLDLQLADASAPTPFHAEEPGQAKLEVEPLGPVHARPPIRVHGEILAKVETTCVRCLQLVEESVAAELDITLFPEGSPQLAAAKAEDEEEGLSPAELDEGTYGASELDLPALIREALLLEVSMNPACADEEACTDRTSAMLKAVNAGTDLAKEDRWAALKRLVEPAKD